MLSVMFHPDHDHVYYQQGNAAIHESRSTTQWLQGNAINVMERPSIGNNCSTCLCRWKTFSTLSRAEESDCSRVGGNSSRYFQKPGFINVKKDWKCNSS